jgi:ABC-2 type transport system ATP-binding protein
MEAAIQAEHVAKRYGERDALSDVSVEIPPGELFGLVGPDGSGKTTFQRLLAALLRPSGGSARVGGVDVGSDPAGVKRQVGYMSQRFSLSETLTVLENLVYVAEVWGVPASARRQRIARLLEFSRLGPFQDRLAGKLSGGMKQKLGLAACLIHQPRILLLDEPTIGVDPLSRRDFWLILYDLLQEGSTILLSTPYMDEAERCARVGFLLDGRIIACGSPTELKAGLGVHVLELRCAEPRHAQRRLRAVPGFGQTVIFGDRLHVTLPREGFDPVEAAARVRDAGVQADEWSVREPSLEDVFLAYTHRGAGARSADGPS